ncbi:Rrf2 family transcriptional regulator [Oricola sp.]|uniref:Rrf2 family transcriptional regulator n=1 Tax=Oricola sp. TaxID=1979950 RepID=UPI0025ED2A1C|nr:Rrf2 family transcriptional regulator [Oricola sp.]MCI5076789.1 Rrf2 family transcriptional regulator [Oricola sp.]
MRRDSRLSRMLHVLIHMAEHDEPLTSEAVASFLSTNPVVARRSMAGLRDAGFLTSKKGHGGGWALAVPLEKITLLDVYNALGDPAVFAFGPTDDQPDCLVEQAINERLAATLEEARALLLGRFATITLADINADFEEKLKASPWTGKPEFCG